MEIGLLWLSLSLLTGLPLKQEELQEDGLHGLAQEIQKNPGFHGGFVFGAPRSKSILL